VRPATWRGELLCASGRDDPASGEDQDPVGEFLGLGQVVGGEQDRGAVDVGEPVHELVELVSGLRIEPGRRLVEEQQLRPPDDADGDVQPAPLTARQRAHPLVRLLGEPDERKQFVDVERPRPAGPRERFVVAPEVREQLTHAPVGVVAPRLHDDADLGAPPFVGPRRVGPQYLDAAGGRSRNPSRISTVVLLPAPLGPSSASTSPGRTVKSSHRRTSVLP
jgi:hypothetical protein